MSALIEQAKAAGNKAKAAADTARKSAASLPFFTFVSMLIGAFIACAAAALGGHLRDDALILGTATRLMRIPIHIA